MGKQIILCMEADNKSRTDWVYISETIKKYYILSNDVTLSLIFLGGKGKYKSSGTIKKIKSYINAYSKNGESIVVYCIDTDDMQTDPEQKKEFDEIHDYCISKAYKFIWFCRDVEEVYWGKRVSHSEKLEYASRFRNSKQLDLIDPKQLNSSQVFFKKSNLLRVLDQYLERK